MVRISQLATFLETLAPPALAEDWDNVGLLLGDAEREVSAVMTCLTLSEPVAKEAVERQAGFVVSHHPVLFRPVQRITSATSEGRTLLSLLEAGVAVYSPHTGYDSGQAGINQQLAEQLGLQNIAVLRPHLGGETEAGVNSEEVGAGRMGDWPVAGDLANFVSHVKDTLRIDGIQYVGDPAIEVLRAAVACGSAAEFLTDARRRNCQALITGEARFHACVEADAEDMGLILIGHYQSERPAMESLAETLTAEFPSLTVWPSKKERDPIRWA